MSESVEIGVQLGASWRIVVGVPNRCRAWVLERLDSDGWQLQTIASGPMMRDIVKAWKVPLDAGAAVILAQLPPRPTPLERLRKRKPVSPAIVAAPIAAVTPLAAPIAEPPRKRKPVKRSPAIKRKATPPTPPIAAPPAAPIEAAVVAPPAAPIAVAVQAPPRPVASPLSRKRPAGAPAPARPPEAPIAAAARAPAEKPIAKVAAPPAMKRELETQPQAIEHAQYWRYWHGIKIVAE